MLYAILIFGILFGLTTCDEECESTVSGETVFDAIDLGAFLRGDEAVQNSIAERFDKAMQDHGFIHLTEHGCNENALQSLYNATNDFFMNSNDIKMKYHKGKYGSPGYMPYGLQSNKIEIDDEYGYGGLSDLVESYDIRSSGYQWFLTNPKWSEIPAEFSRNNVLKNYIKELSSLLSRVNYLASYALDLPQNYFEMETMQKMKDTPFRDVRFNYYFDLSDMANTTNNAVRLGAHTDFLGFNLLFADQVCGLQVFINNKWTDVPYKPNSFLVIAGDAVMHWTYRRWTASKHRVIVCGTKKRISISFFTGPSMNALLSPMPNCKKCTLDTTSHIERKIGLTRKASKEKVKF